MIADIQPIHQFTYEGAQIFVYHANKGQGKVKHSHSYSHATLCNAGKIIVRVDNLSGGFNTYEVTKETQPLNLTANKWHEIEAVEDGTVFLHVFAVGKY